MSVNYPKTITSDFVVNQRVDPDRLAAEIEADAAITTPLVDPKIHVKDGVCNTWFQATLSAPEIAAFNAIVAAHTGDPPALPPLFLASSKLVNSEVAITALTPDNWEELGGAVTTPDFLASNLAACLGRVIGRYRSDGDGAKIRICEDGVPAGEFTLPNTSGQWATMQWFASRPPAAGTHEYTIGGQKPAGVNAAVKFVSVSLLEAQ